MSFLLTPARRATPSTTLLSRTLRSSLSAQTTRLFSQSPTLPLARMTLVGRLGTDPELSETPRGQPIIKYSVGTSYGPKDNRQTSWFRVAAFTQENSGQRDYIMGLAKGTLVYLEGDATMRTFEDSEGKKQSALSLVQTKIEVLKRPQPVEDRSE